LIFLPCPDVTVFSELSNSAVAEAQLGKNPDNRDTIWGSEQGQEVIE
jgi:hypothetical protein